MAEVLADVLPADGSVSTSGTPPVGRARPRVTVSVTGAVLVALAVAAIVLLLTNSDVLQAAVLGTASGALVGALALGIVVTYRGSGVVNVAVGAMAMYDSYIFASIYRDGDLLVLAWRVHLGAPWAFVPALILTVALSAIWGGIYYLVIFAPLRGASPVAKLVSSVGLLLVLQSIISLQYGSTPISVSVALGNNSYRLPMKVVLPESQLLLIIIVVAAAIVLWSIYRFTGFGLSTRAAAEDERHLTLLGHSPLFVSGGNWMFTGMTVGLFAVLATAVDGAVDPTTLILLVLPALAAALIGRFTSFGIAAAGGLVIGMAQAVIQFLGTKSWYPQSNHSPIPGIGESVPLVIILVVLLAGRRKLPSRGTLGTSRLPFAPTPHNVLVKLGIGLAIGIAGFFVLSSSWRLAEINTMVGIAVCLSFVVLTGFVGQVSLAQMGFAGLSAFVLAKVSTAAGIGFPLAPLIAAVGATGVGLVVAIPALRVRGVQLAIVTMAAGLSIQSLVFVNPYFSNGIRGASVPQPRWFGLKFGLADHTTLGDGHIPNPLFGVFCTIVVVALAGLVSALRLSSWGRAMLAVRANERSAAASGLPVAHIKVAAFGLSSFIAGIAGALSAYRFGSATSDYYGVIPSLTFLAFAYMGGISSVSGAVIGGCLVTNGLVSLALDDWCHVSPSYSALIGGVGLIVTVIANPDGIAGQVRTSIEQFRIKRRVVGMEPAS